MPELGELGSLLQRTFDAHLRSLDPEAPPHRVEFSTRITESWALIYFRRRLIRLSPYLFLLDAEDLQHGSHWRELDATLRHEAAHAYTFYRHGGTAHDAAFHEALARLGVDPRCVADLGPENAAFRYVYACPTCGIKWPRRQKLRGNHSCGSCAPGRYDAAHCLVLQETRDLRRELRRRTPLVLDALAEGSVMLEAVESAACGDFSSSATLQPRPQASP